MGCRRLLLWELVLDQHAVEVNGRRKREQEDVEGKDQNTKHSPAFLGLRREREERKKEAEATTMSTKKSLRI